MSLLGVVVLVATAPVLFALRRRPVPALFLTVFVLHYLPDLALTHPRTTLFFTPTESRPFDGETTAEVLIAIVLCFLVAAAIALAFAPRDHPVGWRLEADRRVTTALLVVLAALSLRVVLDVRDAGIGEVLAQRTLFIGDSPVLLLVYFAAPVGAVVALALRWSVTGKWAAFCLAAGACCVAATIVTGSRSNILLSLFLPAAHLYVARTGSGLFSRRVIARVALLGIVVGTATTLGMLAARGGVASLDPTTSTDLTQFDAAALQFREGTQHPSYGSGLTWPVPRSAWPGKPSPGNRVFSEDHFGARLESSGAEVTIGLLGEAHMNVGPVLAGPVAGLVLGAAACFGERLLRSARGSPVLMAVSLAVTYRSLNVIRSDLVNALVPAMIALGMYAVMRRRADARDRSAAFQGAT